MAAYENLFWMAADGVRLHVRDYPGDRGRPPILCLPGLTRNARDFEELAERLAGDWRVLALDLRGRGESGYAKDPASYTPAIYVADVQALLVAQQIGRFIAVGTSLGGIITMLLAAAAPGRIAAALLNDIGPELEPAGLARIRSYVGRASSYPTWMHAARAVQESSGDIFPDWRIEDWLATAKRLYRLTGAGRIVLDYDLRIGDAMRAPAAAPAPDLWAAFGWLRAVPTLIVRGERSDLFGAAVAERMVTTLERGELATVPRVGHAPTLSEPELAAPIERLLAQVT